MKEENCHAQICESKTKAVIPSGYKMVDGKIVVDKAEADIIKEAFENVENGKKLDDELLNAQRKLKELK